MGGLKLLLVSFAAILVAVLGMSLGVLLGRGPIQGRCGGAGDQCGTCARGCRTRGANGAPRQPPES